MRHIIGLRACLAVAAGCLMLLSSQPAHAYIGGPPASLGMMCHWSTHAVVVEVDRVDSQKGVIIFRKVREVKGKWPAETIRHAIPQGLAQRAAILQWAEPGRRTVVFALESYKWSHTYVDSVWYASNTGDWQWWNVSHAEPALPQTVYAGKTERLISTINDIYAGKEVIIPCVAPPKPGAPTGPPKLHRVRASLKRLDHNLTRDFFGPGGDDFTAVGGMPGFSQYSPLPRIGLDAQAISVADFDGDGKPDLCLFGASKVSLLQNGGDYFSEVALPGLTGGCRAAVWADYNGDGKPDLLLATPNGPKLYTNLGGTFRDDSHLLPKEASYNLTAAAWIDYDGDGKPDILLGNGYHGLRLYRNKGKADPALPAKPGQPPVPAGPWFEDVSDQVGLGVNGIGSRTKGDTLTVCDVDGDGRPDFLYGAGTGILVLNTPKGFVEAKDSGIRYQAGKVGPVFGDFDSDGKPDLFVPQADGCKLFRNEGNGKFTDVTAKAGDLWKFTGNATSAAWGDVDNDGRLDLVIGCLKGPNRFFRNKGDGTFEDASDALGLSQRVFNTQAVCLVDLNNDGNLDLVFNNEGQESCALLGNGALAKAKRTPLTLQIAGSDGVIGSRVRVLDKEGKLHAETAVSGGDGRGGQATSQARFALPPGAYRVEVRYSSGVRRGREITVATAPLRGMLDERVPKME